jgi:hypothetical protein
MVSYIDHFNRIREVVRVADVAMWAPSTLEYKKATLLALYTDFNREFTRLVTDVTDTPFLVPKLRQQQGDLTPDLEGVNEPMLDALLDAFEAAIEARDDRRSPESKSAAKADYQRSLAHG